jgi:signal peptidase I
MPWWRVRVSPGRQAVGLALLALAAVFFYAMLAKGMRFFVVDSISMEPTLHGGDRLVAMRPEAYERGDIIIVRDFIEGKGYLVKRVIGLAGDTIEVRGGAVYLNGQYLSEPYRPAPIEYRLAPYRVPANMVFVLGDNSNRSVDSHNWAAAIRNSKAAVPGAVPLDSVVARAFFQYYPPGRIGRVRGYPLSLLLDADLARSGGTQTLQ